MIIHVYAQCLLTCQTSPPVTYSISSALELFLHLSSCAERSQPWPLNSASTSHNTACVCPFDGRIMLLSLDDEKFTSIIHFCSLYSFQKYPRFVCLLGTHVLYICGSTVQHAHRVWLWAVAEKKQLSYVDACAVFPEYTVICTPILTKILTTDPLALQVKAQVI